MKEFTEGGRFRKGLSLLICVCLLSGVFPIYPVLAQEAWCTVYEDLSSVLPTCEINLPMDTSGALFRQAQCTTALPVIPADEVYRAAPGSLLRKYVLTCADDRYELIISKPRLPSAFQSLAETTNINYLMITSRSGRNSGDDSANGSYTVSNKYGNPTSVYLMAFDPNHDFEMSVTVYSTRFKSGPVLDFISYTYETEEIWGVQFIGTDIKDSGMYVAASVNHTTKSFRNEDPGLCHVSYDSIEIPDDVLSYFRTATQGHDPLSVWDYHHYEDPSQYLPPRFTVPDDYEAFLMRDGYLRSGQTFCQTFGLPFVMWDMDGDGEAELLLHNGAGDPGTSAVYVYTVRAGTVQYLGSISAEWPADSVLFLANEPGVLVYSYDPYNGNELFLQYRLQNSSLAARPIALEGAMYYRYLHWYTAEQVRTIGWNNFRSAPFTLDALHLEISADTEAYMPDVPIRAAVSIPDGTPPFSVRYKWESEDRSEGFVSLLSAGYNTEKRELTFQFTPEPRHESIFLNVAVTDLYGTGGKCTLCIDPKWTNTRFYRLMGDIFSNVPSYTDLRSFAYHSSLPKNSAWFSRSLQILTGLTDPIKSLKNVYETLTAKDKKKYLQKASVLLCATEDTFQLPDIRLFAVDFSGIKSLADLGEPQYLDACGIWLDKRLGRDDMTDSIKSVYARYVNGTAPHLEYELKNIGLSGQTLNRVRHDLEGLETLGIVLKKAKSAQTIVSSVRTVFNQMAVVQTMDPGLMSAVAGMYELHYPEHRLSDSLYSLAAADKEERARLIWEQNALLMADDAMTDLLGKTAAAKAMTPASAFLDSAVFSAHLYFNADAVAEQVYDLSMSVELTTTCWSYFHRKRTEFIHNPNYNTFRAACYAYIIYCRAAAMSESAFQCVVESGRKALLREYSGFGSAMSDASYYADICRQEMGVRSGAAAHILALFLDKDCWEDGVFTDSDEIRSFIDRMRAPTNYIEPGIVPESDPEKPIGGW